MSEKVNFGFETTRTETRLSLDVPGQVIDIAAMMDAGKPGRKKTLGQITRLHQDGLLDARPSKKNPRGIRLGINAVRIGSLRPAGRDKTLESVTSIVDLLGGAAPADKLSDEKLRLQNFKQITPGMFLLSAQLDLPASDGLDVGDLVYDRVVDMYQALSSHPEDANHLKIPEDCEVRLSRSPHIEIRLKDASVATTRSDYDKSSRIELQGYNINFRQEGLALLAGIVALAHADEYLENGIPPAQ